MRDAFPDRTNDEFLQEVLNRINELRARHGSAPLTLDAELVEYAKSRAAFASTYTGLSYNHADLRSGTGENASWRGASSGPAAGSGTAAVNSWYAEIEKYDFAQGQGKNPGDVTGHFTALVWKNTTKLGVGRVAGQGPQWWETYVVANFSPPGNVTGQYVMNVVPPTS